MSTTRTNAGIGVGQGTAIYVAAILGAGILALPSLAAKIAGPASILAWVGLVLLSIPIAATFAAMGARYPDGGGVATFVSKAFGRRASAVVGYWFYFALPAGAPATAFVGGQYVASALGGDQREAVVVAAVLITAGFATNALGSTTYFVVRAKPALRSCSSSTRTPPTRRWRPEALGGDSPMHWSDSSATWS
jgi:amino acid efflux transporter